MTVLEHMKKTGIVPVVVIHHAEDALMTADALLAGGIDVMEITMRTDAALSAINAIKKQRPQVLVGAGTVVTLEQCRQAVEAGAAFIVAPGYDAEVVVWCLDNAVPVLPGCVTPTELMMAMEQGLNCFKFFPAGIYGGLKALKALSGPFPTASFVPTGGINGENLTDYLSAPFVQAVGGSWMCTAGDIAEHRWEKITNLSTEAVTAVRRLRQED